MGRYVTGLILILAVITSPLSDQFPGIYVYVQTINSFVQGPIFAVLLLGIFSTGLHNGGIIWFVAGIMFSGILYFFKEDLFTIEDPFLYISWWSFFRIIVIVTIIVSVFTNPKPLENLSRSRIRVDS